MEVTQGCQEVPESVTPLRTPEPSPRYRRRRSHVRGTQAKVSSDEEPLVRPNNGRHVVPTCRGGIKKRCRWQSTKAGTLWVKPCVTVAASPGVLLAAGVLCGAPPTPIAGRISENRFFHLGTELDTDSSTEEIFTARRRPSRLVLV